MAYDFHYTPTGTGVISGKEVLEQTEDAINDLGNTAISGVQEALDKAEQALTNSENAVDDAQTALNTANTAYTAATNAQNTANTAQNTASNALTAAQNAQNDVNALGNRVTTAEGNITQNTNAITGLTTRMGTAEGNIGNLQTAVSTAQATANSAQQTATTARQQSYVLRYSSSSVTDNSTIAYNTLDNTDNVKSGDKVIDVDGKIFSVVSVDTANQTVTVGSALIDLALDANVVHTSGTETVSGQKTFANNRIIVGRNTDSSSAIQLVNSDVVGGSASGTSGLEVYGSSVSTDNKIGGVIIGEYSNNGGSYAIIECNRTVSDVKTSNTIRNLIRNDGSKEFSAGVDNDCKLGHPYFRWSEVYATNYYYGSNNVEFSTKFVTTDTNQTITGQKTFSSINTNQINGLTPSSLGMPTDNIANIIDISGYLTVLDGSQANTYQAPDNGYIGITMNNCPGGQAYINGFWGDQVVRPSIGVVRLFIPVCKNMTANILIFGGTINSAKFFPCQGNI